MIGGIFGLIIRCFADSNPNNGLELNAQLIHDGNWIDDSKGHIDLSHLSLYIMPMDCASSSL